MSPSSFSCSCSHSFAHVPSLLTLFRGITLRLCCDTMVSSRMHTRPTVIAQDTFVQWADILVCVFLLPA